MGCFGTSLDIDINDRSTSGAACATTVVFIDVRRVLIDVAGSRLLGMHMILGSAMPHVFVTLVVTLWWEGMLRSAGIQITLGEERDACVEL